MYTGPNFRWALIMSHPFSGKVVAPPKTVAERAVHEVRKYLRTIILFNVKVAEEIGVSLIDMQLLHILNMFGPATPGRLAEGTGLSTGGVTVALDRLERLGYIRRERNPADRRSLIIHLVVERLTRLSEIYKAYDDEVNRKLSGLPDADFEAVRGFFQAVNEIDTLSVLST